MTAKVTEDRQYRYFDHWLTDTVASRLLLVNTSTKNKQCIFILLCFD